MADVIYPPQFRPRPSLKELARQSYERSRWPATPENGEARPKGFWSAGARAHPADPVEQAEEREEADYEAWIVSNPPKAG